MKIPLLILVLVTASAWAEDPSDGVEATLGLWRQWLSNHPSRQLEYLCTDDAGGPADGIVVREGTRRDAKEKGWYYEQCRQGQPIPAFVGFRRNDEILAFFPLTGKLSHAVQTPLPLSTNQDVSFVDRLLEQSTAQFSTTEEGNRVLTLIPSDETCPSLLQQMFLAWPEAGLVSGPISLIFSPGGALQEMLQYVYKDGGSYRRSIKVTVSEITAKTRIPWIPKVSAEESLEKISFSEGALETLILEKSTDELRGK